MKPAAVAAGFYLTVWAVWKTWPHHVASFNDIIPWINTVLAFGAGVALAVTLTRHRVTALADWPYWLWAMSLMWIGFWLGRSFLAPRFGYQPIQITQQSFLLRVSFAVLYVIPAGIAAAAISRRRGRSGTN